jgi:hypothetical protein
MFNDRGSIWTGIDVGLALSMAAIVVLGAISGLWRTSTGLHTFENPAFGAILFIGVAQIVWMLPAALVLLVARRGRALKGLLIVWGVVLVVDLVFMLPVLAEGISGRFP